MLRDAAAAQPSPGGRSMLCKLVLRVREEFVRKAAVAALLLSLALVTSSAHAAPCGGFTDVDSAAVSPEFCQSVDWMKNRGITLGCTSTTLYCPDNSVTRLQMAAFMRRLAFSLAPTVANANVLYGSLPL